MRAIIGLLASTLVSLPVVADEAGSRLVFATPVFQQQPKYPTGLARLGQQGWVDLYFVISEEGTVIDPMVEDSSGQREFERSALEAIERWRFEPARREGEAVPQRSIIRLEFTLNGAEAEVSRSFARRYRRVEKALSRGDVDGARAYLAKAFDANGLSLGELSWLWALSARIAAIEGDEAQELIAVRRALAGSETWIPADLRASLLKTRFALEVNDGKYALALDAFEALQDIDGFDTSPFEPVVEQVEALAEGDKLLVKSAVIGGSGDCERCATRWRHKPLRRAIEIADVDGALERLEIRCDWARHLDTAREGVAWEIPEDWGDCTVIVSGATGATFKLVELPAL